MRDRAAGVRGVALTSVGVAILLASCATSTGQLADRTPADVVTAAQPLPTVVATVAVTTPTPTPTASPTTTVDVLGLGQPWGPGLTMFRGNPTRTFHGRGPVPSDPTITWRHPRRGSLCSESVVNDTATRWCGTGWTGQPLVWERPDGVLELIVGTYDRHVHFLDAITGEPTRTPFRTGDLIKGTPTLDPDGHPLLYVGSRDNRFRIVALDRGDPVELHAIEPHPRGVWNNDWDSNAIVTDDLLLLAGEDSWFRVVELHRGRDADGLVTVAPEVLVEVPGFDDQLFDDLRDNNVSIESSPVLVGDTVYIVNSGGLVTGWDLTRVREGLLPRTFRYWLGDDADATMVALPGGDLVAAVELERFLDRADEVGQLVRLDPTAVAPLVWSVAVPPRRSGEDGGLWSTPAWHRDRLYVTTHAGDLLVVDADTGEVRHEERIGHHEWSSPVVVDDVLVVGLCETGGLRAYDLADPDRPVERWTVDVGGCVESTPAVWDGSIWIGHRGGQIHRVADP